MQETYQQTPDPGLPGMLSRTGDHVVGTKYSDADIPFGRLVSYDAADRKVKLPAASTDVTTKGNVQGIALRSGSRPNTSTGLAHHVAGNPFDVCRKGPVMVYVEQDVLPTDKPFVRFTDNAGVDEVVTMDCTGTPASGEFTLAYSPDGVAEEVTEAMDKDVTAEILQAALEALPSIGTGNVTVTGTLAGGFVITFGEDLGLRPVGDLYENSNTLQEAAPGDVTLTIAVDTYGELPFTGCGNFRKDADDTSEAKAAEFKFGRFTNPATAGSVVELDVNIIGSPMWA